MATGSATRCARAQFASFALGTSAFAIAMGTASPAAAQCAPDPTVANGTTNCVGLDGDGLNVPTSNTHVTVAVGAQVTPGAGDAASIVSSGFGNVLTVAGEVAGGSRPGVLVTNGVPYFGPCDPYAGASPQPCPNPPIVLIRPTGSTSIVVGEGGSISGSTAIRLQRRGDNNIGQVWVTVDNAGSLTATAGPALVAQAGTIFHFRLEDRGETPPA
jgi:hypothetical protein